MQKKTLYDIASHKKLSLPTDMTIAEAMAIMKENSISSIVIIDEDEKPIGIFTERDALKSIANDVDPNEKVSKYMTLNPFVIDAHLKIQDAYLFLESKGFRHLILVDEDGRYQGVVTQGDFIRNLGIDDIENKNIVKDVMTPSPVMVAQNTSIKEVAKLMRDKESEYVIVVDKNNNPINIIQERDIAYCFIQSKNLEEEPIGSLKKVNYMHLVHKDVDIKEAIALMEKHGVHQLIVVDENKKILGLLDRHSVLKTIYSNYIDFLLEVINVKSVTLEELRASQAELADKTILFRNLLDTIPDLIWLKDTKGRFLSCNKQFEEFFNVKEEDLLGTCDYHFIDEELSKKFLNCDLEVVQSERQMVTQENVYISEGEEKKVFQTIRTPVKNAKGEVFGVLCIARDITKILEQIEVFNEAQRIAHIGSWKIDIKSGKIEWSDETYRIFGVAHDVEVDASLFMEKVHVEDRVRVQAVWVKALQGEDYEIEHRIVVDGKIKWVREKAKFVQDKNGEMIYALGTVQDITLYREYEQKLLEMANSDQLTGLANRVYLQNALQKVIESSLERDRLCGLLLFDLDNFKDINDSFGHKIGDEVLVEIAKRLKKRLRPTDIVARLCEENTQKEREEDSIIARLGGDEFVVVLSSVASREDILKVAKDIMDIIFKPIHVSKSITLHIGSSVGIAVAPEHSVDPNELLQFADSALYKAKSDGRAKYAFYYDALTQKAKSKVEGESRLREAIINNEFEVYYQPQVHIDSGRIIGAEALVRWNDPQKGLVSPDIFIPLAERTDMIVTLGEWVLKESCITLKKWLDKGYRLHVSVNVSANQIHYYDMAKLVEDILEETQLPAEKLILELTESIMMKKEEQVVEKLHRIRSKGVRLSIDDFGTGYSSYSYLKRFPIDELKIDKAFIDDIPYDGDNVAIVKGIIAMAKAMGYQVLAEGVEEKEQAEFLKENGCDYYQGYLKSKPLPAKEFEKLLEANMKRK